MRIVVTGSLAYDYLMTFPGRFGEYLLPDQLANFSVSFLVDTMRRMRGGVAGNIAYAIALLGEQPTVAAAAGQDFGEYAVWMRQHGIDTSALLLDQNDFTASCFINTDSHNSQLVAFYPGAAVRSHEIALARLGLGTGDLVIISPTDPESMLHHTAECRAHGIPFLFDPGKQTPRLSGEQILGGLDSAAVLVSNAYEFAMMAQKTGLSESQLIATTPITVITRGEAGSELYRTSGGVTAIPIRMPVAPVAQVLDPTGAGDAYLGGLVFGLARGLDLAVAGRVAALSAAYCIEQRGCQEHSFTRDAFLARYTAAFGTVDDGLAAHM